MFENRGIIGLSKSNVWSTHIGCILLSRWIFEWYYCLFDDTDGGNWYDIF